MQQKNLFWIEKTQKYKYDLKILVFIFGDILKLQIGHIFCWRIKVQIFWWQARSEVGGPFKKDGLKSNETFWSYKLVTYFVHKLRSRYFVDNIRFSDFGGNFWCWWTTLICHSFWSCSFPLYFEVQWFGWRFRIELFWWQSLKYHRDMLKMSPTSIKPMVFVRYGKLPP